MNKTYSRLGWFVFGVITGAIGLYLWMLYQIYSKPVLPTTNTEKHKIDFVLDFRDWGNPVGYRYLEGCLDQNCETISEALDDTQPVKI